VRSLRVSGTEITLTETILSNRGVSSDGSVRVDTLSSLTMCQSYLLTFFEHSYLLVVRRVRETGCGPVGLISVVFVICQLFNFLC